jgi:hypothetical protein
MTTRKQGRKARNPSRPAGRFHSALLLALLLLAPLILYSGSLQYPLVFDDSGLHEKHLRGYAEVWRSLGLRWLPYATFGWTYELIGTGLPWHRLGNIILHALTSISLFALFRRLFGAVLEPPKGAGLSPAQLAFFGALIFALHPISVYGVAYLVERSIVMATLFSVLSLLAFLEGLLRGGRRWFLAAAALYYFAVFSKEHSVMLPAVAVALALLLRRPSWSLARELWLPFAAFVPIGALVVLKARGFLGAPYESLAPVAVARLPEAGGDPYFLSVITQCWLYFKYLFLWIVPHPAWMSVDMRQKFATELLSWPETAGLIAFVLYAVIAARLLLKGGRRGLAGFGLLFPWLFFLAELSTVRIQEPFVLYRAYLWTGGLAGVVPLLLPAMAARRGIAILSAFCLALVPLSLNRLESFSSVWKLWDDAVQKNTDRKLFLAERSYKNRGSASVTLGNYSDAIRDFSLALEISPRDPDAYLNRGMASMQLGSFSDALNDFALGLEIKPGEPAFYVNRGIVHAMNRRYDEALLEFDRALALQADSPLAHFNRGQTLRRMLRFDEGAASFRKSCALGHPPACTAIQGR